MDVSLQCVDNAQVEKVRSLILGIKRILQK